MEFFKAFVSYDGSLFQGWQKQSHTDKTIQGQIENALKKIHSSKVYTLASGRTDSGVHALNQTIKIELDLAINPESLKKAINSHLPSEIRILKCEKSNPNFHPVRDCKKKTYLYYFSTEESHPLLKNYIYFHNNKLDIEEISKCCSLFKGEHNFFNYYCTGTNINSTVRTIFDCKIDKLNQFGPVSLTYYCLNITGSGFLKQMVRLIMGTLLNAGEKKYPKQIFYPPLKKNLSITWEKQFHPVVFTSKKHFTKNHALHYLDF